ncbi:hypothetical protein M514_04908 [Trichuris suis]|uniref:WH2 domain-containing protein n=1 Tax=Trichuris suis TaxID=68888 RepID=A0A085NP52_9BILA|nr:hypothetical protein M513_04908 [Trichuris suis]KFD71248.1 hypothetical protein M514_04908 [Trichuris suis]
MMAAPPPPPLMTQLTPPPPPLPVLSGKVKKPPAAASTDRQALLADIRRAGSGGVRLKPTKTNDRSAPNVGGVSETSRSNMANGPAAAAAAAAATGAKLRPTGMVDFASELNRAVNAQHQKTLKRTNGRLTTSGAAEAASSDSQAVTKRPVVPLATKPVVRQQQSRQATPDQPDQQQQHAVKVRQQQQQQLTVGSKPAPNPNKPNFRVSVDSVPQQDSTTRPGPVSGVSVKALRAKLQNPPQMMPPSSHLSQHRPNGASHEIPVRHQSSSPSLVAFGRPSVVEQTDQEKTAGFSSVPFAKAPPPPLPAKPPSRKPSIEHRKNVSEKFRTLKPQSTVQKQFLTGPTSKYRSSSSENLPGMSPEANLASDAVAKALMNNRSDIGSRGMQRVQSHRPVISLPVGPRPTPPPRPDVAPPPPPAAASSALPQKLFGSKSSVVVPPPPPRVDSLGHELERRFFFKDARYLPSPPEFRQLRPIKRVAPKPPTDERITSN